jgi:hypothetical protein
VHHLAQKLTLIHIIIQLVFFVIIKQKQQALLHLQAGETVNETDGSGTGTLDSAKPQI